MWIWGMWLLSVAKDLAFSNSLTTKCFTGFRNQGFKCSANLAVNHVDKKVWNSPLLWVKHGVREMTTPVCPFYLNKVTSLLKGNAVGKLHGTITPSVFRKRGSAIERRAGGRENLMVIATLAEIHRISCVISSVSLWRPHQHTLRLAQSMLSQNSSLEV